MSNTHSVVLESLASLFIPSEENMEVASILTYTEWRQSFKNIFLRLRHTLINSGHCQKPRRKTKKIFINFLKDTTIVH